MKPQDKRNLSGALFYHIPTFADRLTKLGHLMAALIQRKRIKDASKPATRVVLRPAYGKLVEVVLCLLHEAERLEMPVTTYELVKAVFLADRKHLNIYGRPITFDRYLAMLNGPVGHTFYNLLKEDPRVLRLTGPVQWKRRISTAPRHPSWADKGPLYEYFDPMRPVDLDNALSESDVEELQSALQEVKRLGVSGVWRKTHSDPAYLDAWVPDGGKKSYPMNIVLLFDKPCEEDVEDLLIYAENSR